MPSLVACLANRDTSYSCQNQESKFFTGPKRKANQLFCGTLKERIKITNFNLEIMKNKFVKTSMKKSKNVKIKNFKKC